MRSAIVDSELNIIRRYSADFPAVEVSAGQVNSICYGVVISVHNHAQYNQTVVVQFDRTTYFAYSGFLSVAVNEGDRIKRGDMLGTVDGKLIFEYLTPSKQSRYWLFLNGVKLYRNDPTPYVEYDKSVATVVDVSSDQDSQNSELVLTSEMEAEFTGNRGEESE